MILPCRLNLYNQRYTVELCTTTPVSVTPSCKSLLSFVNVDLPFCPAYRQFLIQILSVLGLLELALTYTVPLNILNDIADSGNCELEVISSYMPSSAL